MLRTTWLHSHWEFASPAWLVPPGKVGFSALEWLPATVPGHVHLDLVAGGVIAHPFSALHELGCQWVDETDWSYRTSFEFRPDPALPRRVIRFESLDTVARVSLNGEKLADHDNMFVPLELDVSGRLREGVNELEVEFQSAPRVGRERRARYLESQGLPNDVVRFDDRAFVRKPQYMFGWDWGPRLVSAGIAGKVSLVEHAGRILDVHVRQRHLEDGACELSFVSEIEGGGQVWHLLEGFPRPIADGEVVKLERPELWWPAGFGAQRLYGLTSLLLPPGVSSESSQDKALDRRRSRIGLRRLRLIRKPDAFGQSFEFEVNDRRVFAAGANWIPDHSFPSTITRERLRSQLLAALDMNMNMLRIWGGGLYESDDFYDLCDELGLLVWQDFPYACSYYPDDAPGLGVARAEARSAVKRLRNRPSLAIWCGNNENLTMFESKWGGAEWHPPRYYGEPIFERVLPEVVAELDGERPYIPTSPWGGEPSNSGGVGDQHYWDVWHGRGDWRFYDDSSARFASEFGFASAPSPKAWQEILGSTEPRSLEVRDRRARFHDKTAKGYETFIGYVELHYPVAKDLEEWSYHSQLNQRDALRHGIEHYRRSEYCRGSLIWQINDCWPVQSWAVLDSHAEYKAAAFELRRLYAPALVSLVVRADHAEVFAILDNAASPLSGPLVLEARSLSDGRLLARWEAKVELRPDERKRVLEVELAGLVPEDTLLGASFLGSDTFRLLCEPRQAVLAEPRLRASFTSEGLVIVSDTPVVDLYVWDELHATRFLDNFVTLAAPGRVLLRAERGAEAKLSARSLRGRHALDWT